MNPFDFTMSEKTRIIELITAEIERLCKEAQNQNVTFELERILEKLEKM